MKTVVNIDNKTYDMSQPLFFGKGLALQRYDKSKYPRLFNNFKTQLGFYWRPEEITLGTRERTDFKNLPKHEQEIFKNVLSYQILLDSVQTRFIPQMLQDVSNLELEAAMTWWMAFEQIHSYSYTYIIKDIFNDPSEIFDNILNNPELVKRTTTSTSHYNDYLNSLPTDTLDEKKKKLYLSLVSMNILEGIRFYVSFACSFSFGQNKKMEGNAKIIKLINRDENIHLGMSQFLINTLQNEESEGFMHIAKECEPIVIQMYKDAVQEEMDWAKYLFKDGSILGLNETILNQYLKHLTNKRLKAIGKDKIFEETPNPIAWIKFWTDSDAVQQSPQEVQKIDYQIGAYNNNIETMTDSEFDY